MIMNPSLAILALLAYVTLDTLCGPLVFGAVRAVALLGHQAPGRPLGETFAFGFSGPTINNDGQVVFRGETKISGTSAHTGIWTDRNGTLELFMVSGTAAPSDSTTTYAPSLETYISNTGRVFFEANLTGATVVNPTFPSTTPANNYGIWSDGSGSITKIARRRFGTRHAIAISR